MTDNSKKTGKKQKQWLRTSVQIFFFLLVAAISVNHYLAETGQAIPFLSSVSLHAICPFGGVVSFYNYVMAGSFIQKIHESSFILMIIALVSAILLGPVICGWVCPLGTFQEFIGKIGKKLFKKRYNTFVPEKLDKYLRFIRYIVLVLVVYVTATSVKLLFQNVDPYFALFNFWSSEVSVIALLILGATIILSLFIERPWCKYLCPYGAFLGITNLFRIFKVRRIPEKCIDCKMCDRACPMNIKVSKVRAVTNHQCITCLKCTSEFTCPVSDTVIVSVKEETGK